MTNKYEVNVDKHCFFIGEKTEVEKVFDKLIYYSKWLDDVNVCMNKNTDKFKRPFYKSMEHFENSIFNNTSYSDIFNKGYSVDNKYLVKNDLELKSILHSSPENADLSILDISNATYITNIKSNMILEWNTSHITKFHRTFANINYVHDLDWLIIQEGASIDGIFFNSEFSKKLPKHNGMNFHQFVQKTKLKVTPEIIKNNFDNSLEEWCSNSNNQIFMRIDNLYRPILEYWLNSDFITTEEKIEAVKVSGIEIFDI